MYEISYNYICIFLNSRNKKKMIGIQFYITDPNCSDFRL